MNDLPGALETIANRVEDLEKRVYALEHPAAATAPAVPHALPVAIALKDDEAAMEQMGGWLPVAGRAMFGIAGAYVLRAMAESSAFPRLAIAAAAVLYATGWLVWATLSSKMSSMQRAVYAGTSALILAPMLWELTRHFKVFSPTMTAGVLAAYAAAATLLGWRRNIESVLWVAHGAGAFTALALSIATHTPIPFIATLILMVALGEHSGLRDGGQGLQLLVGIVADAAIGALLFIYTGPVSARGDYLELSASTLLVPACLLFIVNGTSVAIKSVGLKRRISVSEVLQVMIAFLLAASSLLFFLPESGRFVVGGVCLVLSLVCYSAVFLRFRDADGERNFKVFGAWSAGLLLAGTFLFLPRAQTAMCLGFAAAIAIVFGLRTKCRMLEVHGLLFLIASSVASRLPEYVFRSVAGALPVKTDLSILVTTACAIVCYAAGKGIGEALVQQVLRFVTALIAVCGVTALLTQGLLGLAALALPIDVYHVAFIRTLTACAVSLVLAFTGARWGRLEMTHIAYGALAFVAAKILFEDLRHGRMEFIAGSIFLFAVTLIAVPRLVRISNKAKLAFDAKDAVMKKV